MQSFTEQVLKDTKSNTLHLQLVAKTTVQIINSA